MTHPAPTGRRARESGRHVAPPRGRYRLGGPRPRRRQALSVLLVTVVATVGVGAGAVAGSSYTRHNDQQGTLRTSGAVIRVGTKPYIHTNASHAALNITGMQVRANGDLVINRSVQKGDRIVACIAEEDETLVRLGVQVGCSGGGRQSVLQFYRDGKRISAKSSIFGTTSNVWFQVTSFVPKS